jgi:hypothetical protein
MSFVAGLAAEVPVHEIALPFEPFVFGLIALAIFAALLGVLWSYRDVANRHTHHAAPDAAAHAGAPGASHHGSGHGPSDAGAGH